MAGGCGSSEEKDESGACLAGEGRASGPSPGNHVSREGMRSACEAPLVNGMPRLERLKLWGSRVTWAAWLVLLAVVPVTSSPLVVRLIRGYPGATLAAPLAILPLAFLLVVWLLPQAWRGGKLPPAVWPMLLFTGAVLVSACASFFLPILPFKGQTVLGREIRAIVSFGVGLGFYLCASGIPTTDQRLRASLRALYVGAVLMLCWATVQAWIVLDTSRGVPIQINVLHRLISVRDMLPNRVTGMAYEPSWLANQLVLLYLPLWLASVLRGYSVFPRLGRLLTAELALLLWGFGVFLLVQSRIGLISIVTMVAFLYIVGSWRMLGRLVARFLGKREGRPRRSPLALQVLFFLVTAACLLGLLLGAAWGVSEFDPRMGRLFVLPSQLAEIRREYRQEWVYEVANRVAFAERVVYWAAGYRVFESYPVLGVGLGNAGFFFPKTIPAYGYQLVEVRAVLNTENPDFLNPKNLWVRLLAETGIVGFAVFLVWLVVLWFGSRMLHSGAREVKAVIGLAGSLALLAQLAEGFSLDTFALPQMWVILGLLTAAIGQMTTTTAPAVDEE
jgi:hypothetical protein